MPSDARGLVDARPLEKLVDDDVAGLMLTNPNTLGLFEEEIERHRADPARVSAALVYYDGANLNAIIGRVPARRHGLRHRAHEHPQDVRDARTAGEGRGPVRWR